MSKGKILSLVTVSGMLLMSGGSLVQADVVTGGSDIVMVSGVDTGVTDPTTQPPSSTEPSTPTPSTEPSTSKPITKPVIDVPISTVTGDTVIGTENGKVLVQTDNGTQLKDANEVGGEVQKDGTVAIKKSDGGLEVLPHTGESKTIFTIAGIILIVGAIWISVKDNNKKFLNFLKKKKEK